jgi:hypothetical protein
MGRRLTRSEKDGSASGFATRSISAMEDWSIEKKCGLKVFSETILSNASIDYVYNEVLLSLHQSNTPLLHSQYRFQETKFPLGIIKAGSFGPDLYYNIFSFDKNKIGHIL